MDEKAAEVTATESSGEAYTVTLTGVDSLIRVLIEEGYRVIGPTLSEGVIVLDEIGGITELPTGCRDAQSPATYRVEQTDRRTIFDSLIGAHSWKRYLFPSERPLWCASPNGRNCKLTFESSKAVVKPYACLGVRAFSTPISYHVPVDFELYGCPINKHQLLELLSVYLNDREPNLPTDGVCSECKRRGTICVMVTRAMPCLGPVIRAGCGAICPSYNRGCYGCFGPNDKANTESLGRRLAGAGNEPASVARLFRLFTPGAREFRRESEAQERDV